MSRRSDWTQVLAGLPLIPILRGLRPSEAQAVGAVLEQAGFLCLEVPLNSPEPLASIRLLRAALDGRVLVGAGTVVTSAQVQAVRDAGAEFVVSPNAASSVIRATKACGLVSLPGIFTASEAFAALDEGADGLKLFPAEAASPPILRALKSVLPPVSIFPVGGITPANMAEYAAAGAAGFGIGSAIFKAGQSPLTIRENAEAFVAAWRALRA